MTDIDDLIARLERAGQSPMPSVFVVREAAAALRAQRDEIARWRELHRVIAEELGTDMETWPDHRNAPLAIAATFMLHKQGAEKAEAERDALWNVLAGAQLMLGAASLGKPDFYAIRKDVFDAAMKGKP